MPQIPLVERRVAPTTQAPAVTGEANVAPFRAIAQLGGQISDIGFKLSEKMNAEKTDAQKAKYYTERKIRANALNSTLATMDSEEEIQATHEAWLEDENKIFESSGLTRSARQEIANSNQMFYGDVSIAAYNYANKAAINEMDRSWIDVQNKALDGETDNSIINPETNQPYDAEGLYAYATQKRMSLGTVDYEAGKKDIREFGQNLQQRQIVSLSDNDVDGAEKLLKQSTLTGEKLMIANDAVRDARQRQEYRIREEHRTNTDAIIREVNNRQMTRARLHQMSQQTFNVMGKEVPFVPKSVIDANRASLDASEEADRLLLHKRVETIDGLIERVTTHATRDVGQPETDKLYREIANYAKDGGSRVGVESLLNIANSATLDYASKRGWNDGASEEVRNITRAYTAQYAEKYSKYKSRDEVISIINKIDKFRTEVIEPAKGKPTTEDIEEWHKKNMSEIDNSNAVNTYRNTYRVGERKEILNKQYVYKWNGEWEVVD